MNKDFVLRLLPLDPKQGLPQSLPQAGAQVYLTPRTDEIGSGELVLVSLDPDGERLLGKVNGDDPNRLFTRLQRGSVATAKVQEGVRGAIDIAIHVEDFGSGGLPIDGRSVLPSRPNRRTHAVSFADASPIFTQQDVNAWVRQVAARTGECESRGEDLQDFMQEQNAELQAYEERLSDTSRRQFQRMYAAEVERLDQSYASARELMLGRGAAPASRLRTVIWAVVIALILAGLIYEAR